MAHYYIQTNMNKKQIFNMKSTLLALLLLTSTLAFSQNGFIRGKVTEKAVGEDAIGATVKVIEANLVTMTDLDGTFSLQVPAGVYSLTVDYIGCKSLKITEITVKANETTLLNEILLEEDNQQLEEVIVTAKLLKTTEEALNLLRSKSTVMLDGISSAKIRQIGDATAVEAAKRITGVSIEGGKYVYIRGLGDRYSKTTLNNMDIPGLDPDINTVQMDIFPTNLVDNITISKNHNAEQAADFTGGLLNIETKDFPEEKLFSFSFSGGFNPSMHFNPNALSYPGGKTDFLGFDDGTRKLPELAQNSVIPTPISGNSAEDVNKFIRSFNPNLAAIRGRNAMDFGFNFAYGDQKNIFKNSNKNYKLGYIFSVSYKQDQRYFDDVTYGEYQRFIDPSNFNLRYATVQTGEYSEQNVLIGSLAGIALKTNNSKIRLTALHLQNGESRAGIFDIDNDGEAVGQSGYISRSDNLEYNQRALTNIMLNGVHRIADGKWEIDWRVSPTLSVSDDPDIRKTAFTFTPTNTFFSAGAGGNPSRIWRYLSETNINARLDLTKNYDFRGQVAKLKFGSSLLTKERDYEIKFFDIQFFGAQNWVNPDPATVLNPENLFPNRPNSIYYQSGNNDPNPNQYNSVSNNYGFYVSNELSLTPKLKSIVGLRAEKFSLLHTGRDQRFANGDVANGKNLVNEKVLDTFNFFPSINLIQAVSEKVNVRASYSKTIARPSFKEMSFAQILDPITNRIFNGSLFEYADWNGNLVETKIDNADFRVEKFLGNGQLISASIFYKRFLNPIELVRIPEQQTSTEFQPRNVGNGNIFGVELEFNKSLEFLAEGLRNFNLSGNFTYLRSQIIMTDVELRSRKTYEKDGQTIKNTRPMAGQSPYLINGGLTFKADEKQLNLGLFYNVKGETLNIVGVGLFPDVYTMPFHSLNFSANKTFGAESRMSLDFKAVNLLNDTIDINYQSFETQDAPFSSINPGRSYSLGFSYRL